MATIRDVAKEANVSVTTVSRILNDKGAISDKTRKKVFKAMEKLDYHPNELARSLFKKRSNLIGLIIPYLDHPFFSRLTEAIEKECYKRGYKLLICTSDNTPAKELEIFSMLKGNQVDGVLLCSRIEEAVIYANSDLPIVSIERTIDNVPSVCCDNYRGGVLAAQSLIKGGCKHPAIIGYSAKQATVFHALHRYQGFYEECSRNGINYTLLQLSPEDVTTEDLRNSVYQLIMQNPDVDGIFTTSDVLAVMAYTVYRDKGCNAPNDIQIVGFDGLDISEYFQITTIAQPIKQMGEFALDMLLKRIGGQMVPDQSILPVSLIRRKSTRNE